MDVTCPLLTGIFLRIGRRRPKKIAELGDLTSLGVGGLWGNEQLNPKFLGGKVEQARLLVEEGHRIEDGRAVTGKRAA